MYIVASVLTNLKLECWSKQRAREVAKELKREYKRLKIKDDIFIYQI